MKRLVTFGCSHTSGVGLKSKKDGWPYKLASKFNIPLVNKGLAGNSIKGTTHTLSEFNFQPEDLAIVMWPSYARHTVLQKDRMQMIMPNSFGVTTKDNGWIDYNADENTSDLYYKHFYNEYDAIKTGEIYIRYVDSLATIGNFKLIHTFSDTLPTYFEKTSDILSFIKQPYLVKPFWRSFYESFPIPDDYGHINKEGQSLWADILYGEITGKKPLI